jgi:MFS family permease
MYLIALLTLIVQGCNMGSRVAASLFAIQLGANEAAIGALIAVYAVFPLLLSVYSGRASDRYGSRYPMMAGIAVFGLGLLLPWLWPVLPALYASALLAGVGFVFFNVSVQNLAGGYGKAEDRTKNFSVLGLGYSAGHMLGPMIAGFVIDHYSHPAAYLIFALLTLLAIGVLAGNRRLNTVPHPPPAERRSSIELLRNPQLVRAMLISGLVVTGWDLYTFYVPIYGHGIGLSATQIGLVLAVFASATFITRVILPLFTDRYGVERVLSAATFSGAVMLVVFPFVTFLPVLYTLSFCIGLALGCGQPLTLNIAYNRSPPGRSGEVTGLRLTINNVTHITVPLAAGAAGALLGVAPVFLINAAFLATSGYLTRKG